MAEAPKKRRRRPPVVVMRKQPVHGVMLPVQAVDPEAAVKAVPAAMGIAPPPPEVSERVVEQYRRLFAGTLFVQAWHGCTVSDLAVHPALKDVPLKTLHFWSTADRWADRRKVYIRSISDDVEKKMARAQVSARLVQLEGLQELHGEALNKLRVAEPKSYEGVLQAIVSLSKQIEALRATILSEVQSSVVPKEQAEAVQDEDGVPSGMELDELTDDEAHEAAMAVLAQRRERQLSGGGGAEEAAAGPGKALVPT